jgi:hypothetical protein
MTMDYLFKSRISSAPRIGMDSAGHLHSFGNKNGAGRAIFFRYWEAETLKLPVPAPAS